MTAIIQNKSGVAGNTAYKSNYEKIFGTAEERKARHDKEKIAEAEIEVEAVRIQKSASVRGSFDAFVSHVDGSVVSSHAQLEAHNKRNGVTNVSDYGEGYFDRRRKEMHNESRGNTAQAKRERQQLVEKTLYDHGVLR